MTLITTSLWNVHGGNVRTFVNKCRESYNATHLPIGFQLFESTAAKATTLACRSRVPFFVSPAYNEILWFPAITTPHTQMMRISNTALDTRFLIKKRYTLNNNNVIDFLYSYWLRYLHVRCCIDKLINFMGMWPSCLYNVQLYETI